MARVRLIVAVLEAGVLRHGRGVRQVHPVTVRHQAIDEPVPVIRGLNHDTGKFVMEWLELSENYR